MITWTRTPDKQGWVGRAVTGRTHYRFHACLLPDVRGEGCAKARLVFTNDHYRKALALSVKGRSLKFVKAICEAFIAD